MSKISKKQFEEDTGEITVERFLKLNQEVINLNRRNKELRSMNTYLGKLAVKLHKQIEKGENNND